MKENILDHYDYLKSVAFRFTQERESANDLVQETMLHALTRMDKYQPGTNLKSWLFIMMRNLFISYYRVKAPMRYTTIEATILPTVEAKLDLKLVLNQVSNLKKPAQECIILFMKGYKYREIAVHQNTTIAIIKRRLFFARQQLSATLKSN